MNKLPLLFVLLLLSAAVLPVRPQAVAFRILEYNVENLFDTLHAEGCDDAAFTPEGEQHWTSLRLGYKLKQIASTLLAAGGATPIDLVALVEVENDSVLAQLTQRSRLARLGYSYIVTHSPDPRGINVALLYQPARFRPLATQTLRVAPTGRKVRPSRDVLHVSGRLFTGDTLDVFVCHLPSRRGEKAAARYREAIGRELYGYIDSLMARRAHPAAVVTGDFNAFWPEAVFAESLQAELPTAGTVGPRRLYLLSHGLEAPGGIRGTYKYRGEWNQLDNFLVNGSLLGAAGSAVHPRLTAGQCLVVDFPFLLRNDKVGGGVQPAHTFLGTFYLGGPSDHLPLLLPLNIQP